MAAPAGLASLAAPLGLSDRATARVGRPIWEASSESTYRAATRSSCSPQWAPPLASWAHPRVLRPSPPRRPGVGPPSRSTGSIAPRERARWLLARSRAAPGSRHETRALEAMDVVYSACSCTVFLAGPGSRARRRAARGNRERPGCRPGNIDTFDLCHVACAFALCARAWRLFSRSDRQVGGAVK